ncbi:PP0621 family protein [Bathymodiolus septemdierum thioautotrophic gill symbiont]|uniref:TRASH domain-containing protein n=1 Tax=endosymbiont of Bathymodiolus septemdierum str. Myojin knoll TaxID=1303921 RepID=A0A0P0USV6_9GAMM|nr:PP0621 family protein [Bathymodiolus septemdierum thioautotrophic gill symbiont]BAS68285.1 conserved hypothetical protein [endosymbiont of Bathymodiolus septemdierum str. Myojin knoll]
MGIRFIAIALLVFVGFYLFKKMRSPRSTTEKQPSKDKMVACSVCKVHIPENEAIMQNGKIYCSKECV